MLRMFRAMVTSATCGSGSRARPAAGIDAKNSSGLLVRPAPAATRVVRFRRTGALGGVLQELRDFVLDMLDFVQPQMHVGHNENVAGLGVFIDQNRPLVRFARLNLLQDAFSLEHDGENVTGVDVRRIVPGQETPQNIFRAFLSERFWWLRRRWLVTHLPEGERSNIFIALRPGLFAQIFPPKPVSFAKEQRVKLFSGLKGTPGFARMRPRLMLD